VRGVASHALDQLAAEVLDGGVRVVDDLTIAVALVGHRAASRVADEMRVVSVFE
jgi:hypothetical protein